MIYNLSDSPLYRASLASRVNAECEEGQLKGPKQSATARKRFWMIEISHSSDALFSKVETADEQKPLSEIDSFKKKFETIISQYVHYNKILDKLRFLDVIASNRSGGAANFYGGLHNTSFSASLVIFAKLMMHLESLPTKPRKLKLLDVGHGPGNYLILAVLLNFEVVAIDLPSGMIFILHDCADTYKFSLFSHQGNVG